MSLRSWPFVLSIIVSAFHRLCFRLFPRFLATPLSFLVLFLLHFLFLTQFVPFPYSSRSPSVSHRFSSSFVLTQYTEPNTLAISSHSTRPIKYLIRLAAKIFEEGQQNLHYYITHIWCHITHHHHRRIFDSNALIQANCTLLEGDFYGMTCVSFTLSTYGFCMAMTLLTQWMVFRDFI